MRKMDMLHGSIGDKTVSFAILLAVTGICQQLFNAIDIIIMGRFVGKEAMAAVGSNAPVVGLLVTFFVGISLGANVVISQYTGQGNLEKVKRPCIRRSSSPFWRAFFCRARRFQRGFSRQAPSGAKGSRDNVPRVPGNHIHRDAGHPCL